MDWLEFKSANSAGCARPLTACAIPLTACASLTRRELAATLTNTSQTPAVLPRRTPPEPAKDPRKPKPPLPRRALLACGRTNALPAPPTELAATLANTCQTPAVLPRARRSPPRIHENRKRRYRGGLFWLAVERAARPRRRELAATPTDTSQTPAVLPRTPPEPARRSTKTESALPRRALLACGRTRCGRTSEGGIRPQTKRKGRLGKTALVRDY